MIRILHYLLLITFSLATLFLARNQIKDLKEYQSQITVWRLKLLLICSYIVVVKLAAYVIFVLVDYWKLPIWLILVNFALASIILFVLIRIEIKNTVTIIKKCNGENCLIFYGLGWMTTAFILESCIEKVL